MFGPPSTASSIHDLLAQHGRSYAFDCEARLNPDVLAALLDAARWTPALSTAPAWRLIVCDRFAEPETWGAVLGALARPERPWAYNAPVFIVAAAVSEASDVAALNRAIFDCGAAVLQLCLEATARDLASHPTARFDSAALSTALCLPNDATALAVVCVGHRADLGSLGRDVYLRQLTPRQPAPEAKVCYEGVWGRTRVAPAPSSSVVDSSSVSITARSKPPSSE